MAANGRLTAAQLTTVQTGVQLATATAARYKLLKAEAKSKLGRTISIAMPAGGYRSWAVQDAMHKAGAFGPASARIKWGLNPNSKVSIASPGLSTHGTGTRVDIVGTAMDAVFLNLAKKYGFVREFGAADPNHFIDQGTYKISTATKVATKVVSVVSSKKVYVTVKSGDTLTKIARAHSTSKVTLTLATILKLNPSIKNPDAISIGQKVRVA